VLKITAEIHSAKLVPRAAQLVAELAHAISMHSFGYKYAKNGLRNQSMKADGFF